MCVGHTRPPASARVHLPELQALPQARGSHGALAGVGLAVAGAERLLLREAGLRQAHHEAPTGESLHPTGRALAAFAVSARICG